MGKEGDTVRLTWGGDPSDTGRAKHCGSAERLLPGLGGREGCPEGLTHTQRCGRGAEAGPANGGGEQNSTRWTSTCKGPQVAKDGARNREGVRNEALEAGGPRGRGPQVTRGFKDHLWESTVVLGTWETSVVSQAD